VLVRTQVQLTEEPVAELRRLGSERGQSVAEVVRQCVDAGLRFQLRMSDSEKRRRALEVVGAFRSGKHDVSERHDDYLADAYSQCASS